MERGGKQELQTCAIDKSCQSGSLQEISIAESMKGRGSVTLAVLSSNSTCAL